MLYYFDEHTLINNILAEYYTTDEGDYSIVMDTYIDNFVASNTVKMNKKIIKFYYTSSIKKIIKQYKVFLDGSIIHTKSELFRNLTSIIIYNKLHDIIETAINNDIMSNADTDSDLELDLN